MTELNLAQKARSQTLEIFLFCFCVIYIALFCWLGRYARPQADDYGYIFYTIDKGFFPFQKFHYLSINGRVLNVFLVSFAGLFSMKVAYSLLPLLTISFYILTVNFLIKTLMPKIFCHSIWLWTLILTSVTLAFISSLNETVYWLAGMPYFWTSIFLMLVFALAVRALRGGKKSFVLGLCVCFANGTLLEQPCVFQGVVAFLATLYFLWHGDRKRAIICAAFWLTSIAAFLVLYLAPGTTMRIGGYADTPFFPRLARTMLSSFAFGSIAVLKFCIKPLTWIALLFVPLLSTRISKPNTPRLRSWQIFIITILIAPLMQAINGWGTGGGLPARGESLTIWMMGFTWITLWMFCYDASRWTVRLKKLFAWRWGLMVLALMLNFNFANLVYELMTGSAARYAEEHDARDAIMEQQHKAGVRDAVVPLMTEQPNLLLYEDLDLWNNNILWQNRPYAGLWNMEPVYAFPSAICKNPDALARLRNGDVSDLRQLAETDGTAAYQMGKLYDWFFMPALGIEKDDFEALRWYSKAVELGNREAARKPVHLYSRNSSLPNRYIQTIYWIFRSHFWFRLS